MYSLGRGDGILELCQGWLGGSFQRDLVLETFLPPIAPASTEDFRKVSSSELCISAFWLWLMEGLFKAVDSFCYCRKRLRAILILMQAGRGRTLILPP